MSRPGSHRRHLAKTLGWMVVVWFLALVALPAVLHGVEVALGIDRRVLPFGPVPGIVVLAAASLFGIRCAFAMARGEGTPVPFDAAARLVVTGPYRRVRNPMAVSGVGQALGVALLLGSPLYALVPPAGALLWHVVIRPSEERFLAERFGTEFAAYRARVPLWIPRLAGVKDSPGCRTRGGVEAAVDTDAEDRFASLLAAVVEPVRRYLARRTDTATAEDVLSETMLVCWRRLEDVPPGAPVAWTIGVARQCLANARRSEGRRRNLVRRILDLERPGEVRGPDAVSGAAHDVVTGALAALRAEDAEVLRLWAWEELAPREIALVLGVSANAATVRLHRAKGRLRTQLTGRTAAPPDGDRVGGGAP